MGTDNQIDFDNQLIAGLNDALAHATGKTSKCLETIYIFADAKAIRESVCMSQSEFSKAYGIPIKTLQHWEQRRHNPDRTASAYLWTIEEFPNHVRKAQERHHKRSDIESQPSI
jgi:putative transcriptional regulator